MRNWGIPPLLTSGFRAGQRRQCSCESLRTTSGAHAAIGADSVGLRRLDCQESALVEPVRNDSYDNEKDNDHDHVHDFPLDFADSREILLELVGVRAPRDEEQRHDSGHDRRQQKRETDLFFLRHRLPPI